MILYLLIYITLIYTAISITIMIHWGNNHRQDLCSFSMIEFCRRYVMSLIFGPVLYIPRSVYLIKSARLKKAGNNLMKEGTAITNYLKAQTIVTPSLEKRVFNYQKRYTKFMSKTSDTVSSLKTSNAKWDNFVKYHYI